jgi:outer membrane receptor protein involved in Fe transport
VGFNRRSGAILHESSGSNKSADLGFPAVSSSRVDLGFPDVLIAGFDGIGEPRNLPQDRHDTTLHLSENLAWTPSFQGGRHQLQFGSDVRRVQGNFYLDSISRGEWAFLGVFTGDPLKDLLRGSPAFALAGRGDTHTNLITNALGLYARDDLRVTDRLTLNLGLRWDYTSPPVDARNRLSAPDLSSNSLTCSPKPIANSSSQVQMVFLEALTPPT